jgi:putative MATE family efflux protein
MIGFALFMVIMGRVSTMALAATEIVFNILSFSFMPAMGFLYATQTLVSESLGRKDPETATKTAQAATTLCIMLMGSMGILFISLPRVILRIFTPEMELIEMAVTPLVVLGLVQFFDAIGMVHLGALRGAGDNRYPAIADLLLMWLFFLPVTYVTALYYQYGILGGWIALAVYIAGFAALARHRFLTGPWRTIVV